MKMIKTASAIFLVMALMALSPACRKKNAPLFKPAEIKPGSVEYMINEGLKHLNNGGLEQAKIQFQTALAKNPNQPDAVLGMGLVHLKAHEFEASLGFFRQLKKLTPDSMDVDNYLGIIHTELQQYDQARQHLLIAATSGNYQTPENAYANLALLEMKLGNHEAALRYIKKGLEKKKSFPLLHSLEGRVYEALKKWRDALNAYERASAITFGNEISIQVPLARMHALLGDKYKALDILESSLGKVRNDSERGEVLRLISEINSGN